MSNYETQINDIESQIRSVSNQTTKEINIDTTAEQLYKEFKKPVNFLTSPSRYLKPAFFLDSLTSYVKIWWIVNTENKDGSGLTTHKIPIFDNYKKDTDKPSAKNYLKSFNYDLTTSEITVELVDSDNSFAEMMVAQFRSVDAMGQVTYLEIEYGWANNNTNSYKEKIERKQKRKIYLSNNVFAVLEKPELKYDNNGMVNITLKCKQSDLLPYPLNNIMPFQILTSSPGITIYLNYYFYLIRTHIGKQDKLNEFFGNISSLEFIRDIHIMLGTQQNSSTLSSILELIDKIYNSDNSVVSNTFKLNINYYMNNYYGVSFRTTNEYLSNGTWSIESKIRDFIAWLNTNNFKCSTSIIRDFLSSSNNTDDSKDLIKKLCSLFAGKKIHPYYILKYTIDEYKSFVKKEHDVTKRISDFPDFGFIELSIFDALDNKNYLGLLATKEDIEKYWIKNSDFDLSTSDSWKLYLQKIGSKIWYKQKLLSKNESKLYDISEDKVFYENGIYYAPNTLKINMFCSNIKSSEENIKRVITLLEHKAELDELNKTEINNRIKDIKENAKSNIYDFNIIIVFDLLVSDSFFNEGLAKEKILQAYSYRFGGLKNQNFNPGYPTVWDINFPDIKSFEPEFDFADSVTALTTNTKYQIDSLNTQVIKEDEIENSLKQISTDLSNTEITSNEAKRNIVIEKFNSVKKEIEKQQLLKLHRENNKINFNIVTYPDKYSSDNLSDAIELKRDMQTIRKRLMMESLGVKAKMSVLGDASFNINDLGEYIFIKFYNADGSLSFFTGVYSVSNIVQSVTHGNFTTDFELMKDATAGNSDLVEQFSKIAYEFDRIKITS